MTECTCSFCGNKLSRSKSRIVKSGIVYCNANCQKLAQINRISGATSSNQFESCEVTHSLRFWSKVAITADTEKCWVWIGSRNNRGYGEFKINGKAIKSHRYSWILMHGEIPDNLCVLHRCDNPSCVNPSHLFLGTVEENNQDRERKGRGNQPRGTKNGNSKIPDEIIAEIRTRYAAGNVTHRVLSKDLGVSRSYISSIVRNIARV